jgi:hypothetical protein
MVEAPKMQTPSALAMNPGAFPMNRAAGMNRSACADRKGVVAEWCDGFFEKSAQGCAGS